MRRIRIASRGSDLALWQARHVSMMIRERFGDVVEVAIEIVESQGDADRTTPLASFGGVGVFTRAVQDEVLAGRADLAVHSLKDLPTSPIPGLALTTAGTRATRWDVLVGGGRRLADLPEGATIATGSPRRRAYLAAHRPDLVFVDVRGNVPTRLAKRDAGEFDALVLAAAGLERLGLEGVVDEVLGPEPVLPAVGQGALGVERREDDEPVAAIARALEEPEVGVETVAERAFLARLEGGCHLPAGVVASLTGGATGTLALRGGVVLPDGSASVHRDTTGPAAEAAAIGTALAEEVLAAGGAAILAASS